MAYEDFTTYTEVDEGNEVTVDSATPYEFIFYMWVKVKDI